MKIYQPSGGAETPSILLPANLYAVVGKELNIYFDNFINGVNINNYSVDVVTTQGSTTGKQYKDCFNFIPTAAGNTNITVNLYRGGQLAAQASTIIKASAVSVALNKKVMYIGDSNTETNPYVDELYDLIANDGSGSTFTLIGTRGTAPKLHEGRGGWATTHYLNNSTYNGKPNDFWNPTTSAFDFAYYMTTKGFAVPDRVVIQLGTNDVFWVSDVTQYINNLKTMLASIQAYNNTIKVSFSLVIPPANNQDAFGIKNYSDVTRDDFKTKTHLYNAALIKEFDGVLSNVSVIPINTNLDTVRNFPYETVAISTRLAKTYDRISDNLHPVIEGKRQMADSHYYFLKNNLA